jgi:hypothetical protein
VLKRSLIVMHRWLGVALALNFFVWFVSGIGMMYWEFPGISEADRLAHLPSLKADLLQVPVADAFAAAGLESASDVRVASFDGRPVYRLRSGRTQRIVYADSGEMRGEISRQQLDRIAAAWSGRSVEAASIRSLDDVDQWTVQLPLAQLKPVWQYAWPTGEQAYLSQTTGEVVQYTTRAARLGAYVGAIPHWLYVTPLRKHGPVWSWVVIVLSAVATVEAALGLTIGAWTFSPFRRYRRGTLPVRVPYRGWKRWHMILGLIVGTGALTWVFSGLLSMDPIELPGDPPQTEDVADALRGPLRAEAFSALSPHDALTLPGASNATQLELISSGDRSFYVVALAGGGTRIVELSATVHESVATERIATLVKEAVHPEQLADLQLLDRYDRYYLDRHDRRPLPVILVRLNDPDASRFYIDPRTSRLVGTYSARNWVTRWLYHGLHSFDFPWLYRYRPLWDVVVGTFMIGGAALCFTSLVLAWQVLGRAFS